MIIVHKLTHKYIIQYDGLSSYNWIKCSVFSIVVNPSKPMYTTWQANRRRMLAETSQSVQCMRCQTVRWSLACFVEMSWQVEPSDSQMTEFQTEGSLTLKAFADNNADY